MTNYTLNKDISSDRIIAFLSDLFHRGEALSYGPGQVSMCAHMLQTADLARADGAEPALIAASLLHDVGHFGTDFPIDFTDDNHAAMQSAVADHRHEEAGADLLAPFFGPQVSEPVRLHVPAKRYLCAIDPGYFEGLGPTTRHTLGLQGGPMSDADAEAFHALPFAAEAARLRRWDDQAMVADRPVPGFSEYQAMLEDLLARQ